MDVDAKAHVLSGQNLVLRGVQNKELFFYGALESILLSSAFALQMDWHERANASWFAENGNCETRENNYEDDSIFRRCGCRNRDVDDCSTCGCKSTGPDFPQISTGERVLREQVDIIDSKPTPYFAASLVKDAFVEPLVPINGLALS